MHFPLLLRPRVVGGEIPVPVRLLPVLLMAFLAVFCLVGLLHDALQDSLVLGLDVLELPMARHLLLDAPSGGASQLQRVRLALQLAPLHAPPPCDALKLYQQVFVLDLEVALLGHLGLLCHVLQVNIHGGLLHLNSGLHVGQFSSGASG